MSKERCLGVSRYAASGVESEFEPGSRGRVLRNRLGIRLVRDMHRAESAALLHVQDWAISRFAADHRFSDEDVRLLHLEWLGGIYEWAGEYRNVNLAKGDFPFASAHLIPQLMAEFSRVELAPNTPCAQMGRSQLIAALARTHAEMVLIHPFREGNGRCARLLAWLMAMQAGLPPLDFSPLAGRGKPAYFTAVQAGLDRNYLPMRRCFERVINRTLKTYAQPS